MKDIEEGFAKYLEAKLGDAVGVQVSGAERIHGGASRETYRVRVTYSLNGETAHRGMIIRRDPKSSLIETERSTEFDAYTAFYRTKIPVPEPLFLEEENNEWLGRPFFVMEEIEGCESGFQGFNLKPYSEHIEEIGIAKWTILGEIAKTDPIAVGLASKMEMPGPGTCWKRELDYWENVIDQDELEPQPIIRAAIRNLRKTPPPPPQAIGVVHGDYRTGNFLYDGTGAVRSILDWEMCHLGDPLEDLAWAMTPLWGWPDANRPGKLIERDRAIKIWEKTSGLNVNPEAFAWWETFACVKGLAIWISSSREYNDEKNQDPIMIISGWYCTDVHTRVLLDRLAPKGGVKSR